MTRELAQSDDPRHAFQKAFTEAITRWVSGQHDTDYPEPWRDFRDRVAKGLNDIIQDAGEAKDIYAITSGGPISVIAQSLLDLDDRRALKLNEVLANASISRVLFSGSRRSLAVFNSYGHLEGEGPDLVTFR